ncbi:unnamed protein product [Pleuronectes platessa]|uniref:Uncharacterized protein n=1 Tax=Pleuronectes platessa TaxID=8262 RepID=A0A9N7UXD2_PLEPL|nr:unnamed protein product [Pleuronectes platessa]
MRRRFPGSSLPPQHCSERGDQNTATEIGRCECIDAASGLIPIPAACVRHHNEEIVFCHDIQDNLSPNLSLQKSSHLMHRQAERRGSVIQAGAAYCYRQEYITHSPHRRYTGFGLVQVQHRGSEVQDAERESGHMGLFSPTAFKLK